MKRKIEKKFLVSEIIVSELAALRREYLSSPVNVNRQS